MRVASPVIQIPAPAMPYLRFNWIRMDVSASAAAALSSGPACQPRHPQRLDQFDHLGACGRVVAGHQHIAVHGVVLPQVRGADVLEGGHHPHVRVPPSAAR